MSDNTNKNKKIDKDLGVDNANLILEKEIFPDIEFVDDIEFEKDIRMLENMKDKKENSGTRKRTSTNKKTTSNKKKTNANNSDTRQNAELDTESSKGRSNKSIGKSSGKNGSKKKKSRFKSGVLIYAAVLLVIVVGVWIFFYSFIDGYEKGMSYNKIAEIAKAFNVKGVDELFSDISGVTNEFEDEDYAIEYIKAQIDGKEITYKEAKENTSSSPVYEIYAADKAVAKVFLVQDGKIKHGFKNWEIGSIDIDEYLPESSNITIYAPEDAKVFVNGIEVIDTYIVSNEPVEILSGVSEYLENIPVQNKFEIKGFFNTPQIKVVDKEDNELVITNDKDSYTAGFAPDLDTETEFKSYVEDVTYAYARNFANLAKNIFSYVRPGSTIYESIESATTYFYPDSKISSTEFTSREITDFIRYSESCFTCHVKYDYTIYFTGYTIDKDVSSVDMIWTFVEYNGLWYLTQTQYVTE